jgi:hypothetical protein
LQDDALSGDDINAEFRHNSPIRRAGIPVRELPSPPGAPIRPSGRA